MTLEEFVRRGQITQAAVDELIREGTVERLPNGTYRITAAGLAETLDQAATDPAVRQALNDELARLGVPPLAPGTKDPQ
jgi:hypothetical protein